jgi:gliding motility-associated-like protein
LGHGYSGGTVFSFGFPSTTGAFQMNFAGGNTEDRTIGYTARDCGILKYSKDGKNLLYATYIGGTLSNDQPHSMIVDSDLNLLILGTTKSSDFPIDNVNAMDPTYNGAGDIFVFKLSPDGSGMLASTYVGGSGVDGLNGDRGNAQVTNLLYNYADDFRGEITVDANNDVYVASVTTSSNFPCINAFDLTYNGSQDACVFKLNSNLSQLIFSSYFGGTGADAAYGLDLGTHNDLYVTGGTISSSFQYNVPGMLNSFQGGRADGFLFRIDLNDWSLKSATFIGTASYDQSYFVKTDKYGMPFVLGQSEGLNPISPNVFGVQNSRSFLKKFKLDCTEIEIQTTFGMKDKRMPDISPTALMIDECERIFIAGWGGINFNNFPGGGTNNMPITGDAFQKTTDGFDFYLAVFSKSFKELQYATYFGGPSRFDNESHEHVDGGTSRFDKKGVVYQSVCAGCGGKSLFPTTPNVWSNTNQSLNCNNALFKFDFENLNRKPIAKDSTFVLFATDSLYFEMDVSDQDLSDSLRVVVDGSIFKDKSFPKPLPEIQSITRLNTGNALRIKIAFFPNCFHAAFDTIQFYVKVYDQGCPTQDSQSAVIKIVVKDPPVSVTPFTYCLNLDDNGNVKINWDEFEKNRFFKHVLLVRENPNGKRVVIDTLFNTISGQYKDKPPSDPKSNNYTYYMLAYNICDVEYDNKVRVSTAKEFNTPIDSTYMHYATVVNNNSVEVHWLKSTEDDFGSYDVYRANNIANQSEGYRKIHSIYNLEDTFYQDLKVDVSSKSYCYKIVVNDLCGHISKPSNEACNVVLTGDIGHLYFDLDWTPYRNWIGGVERYELNRRVDTGMLRYLINTNLLRVYHDDDLDLWWGAYYYVVKAFEGLDDSGRGMNAQSLSNEIRLIQPPMVFVPNAFSPNDDTYNDVWGVSHAFVKEFRMQVFNRWGEKVWDNDFKGNQWNGVTRGKGAMNDVFVWIVTYKGWDGKFYTQKGTVTVMP